MGFWTQKVLVYVAACLNFLLHTVWMLWSIADWTREEDSSWRDNVNCYLGIAFNFLGVLAIPMNDFKVSCPGLMMAFAVVQCIASILLITSILKNSYRAFCFWKMYTAITLFLAFICLVRTLFGPENAGDRDIWFWLLHLTKAGSYFAVNAIFLVNADTMMKEVYGLFYEKDEKGEFWLTVRDIETGAKIAPCGTTKECAFVKLKMGRLIAGISSTHMSDYLSLLLIITNSILIFYDLHYFVMRWGCAKEFRLFAVLLKESSGALRQMILAMCGAQVYYGIKLMFANNSGNAAKIHDWAMTEVAILIIIFSKFLYQAYIGTAFDEIMSWFFILFGMPFLCLLAARNRQGEIVHLATYHSGQRAQIDSAPSEVKVESAAVAQKS